MASSFEFEQKGEVAASAIRGFSYPSPDEIQYCFLKPPTPYGQEQEQPVTTSTLAGRGLRTIAYCSLMTNPFSPDETRGLVEASARNNAAMAITGALFVMNDRFLQVLEGPAFAIALTYARIHADPRHNAIAEIVDQSIDGRAFSEWSMRLVDLTADEQQAVIGLLARRGVRDDTLPAVAPPPVERSSDVGPVLAKTVGTSLSRLSSREPVRRLLYALETIWAEGARQAD